MKDSTARLCSRFSAVLEVLKENFVWDDPYIRPAAAMSFVSRGVSPDPDRMRECREILRKNTGAASYFRGPAGLIMVSEMSLSDDPAACLGDTLEAYSALTKVFPGSEYLPAAAMMLSGTTDRSAYDKAAALAGDIFILINRRHRLLTSNEDVLPCLTLAVNGMDKDRAADEVEACYELLAPDFRNNPAQALAFALAAYNDAPEKKCPRAIGLYTRLAGIDRGWSGGIGLAGLGPLAMLGENADDTAKELTEIDAYLSGLKEYGLMGIDRRTRMTHAAMLLTVAEAGRSGTIGRISAVIGIGTAVITALASAAG